LPPALPATFENRNGGWIRDRGVGGHRAKSARRAGIRCWNQLSALPNCFCKFAFESTLRRLLQRSCRTLRRRSPRRWAELAPVEVQSRVNIDVRQPARYRSRSTGWLIYEMIWKIPHSGLI
jgi:hypothetical protein